MAYGKSRLTNPEVATLELMPMPRPGSGTYHRDASERKEIIDAIRGTMERLRVAANVVVRKFIRYHEDAGTLAKMEAKEAVAPCPPEFTRLVYRATQDALPDVHGATVLAVQNWLVQTITQQKSPKVNEKRWRRVLRCEESHWSFNDLLPIRLWSGNAKLVRHAGGIAVAVRLFRASGGRSEPLILPAVKPKQSNRTAGHREAYFAACEIADGKRKLAQSQIAFEGGKLFLRLTVDGPAPESHAARDAERILCVRPGRRDAIRIHADTKSGGFGDEILDRVAKARTAIDARRRSWREEHGDIPLPPTVRDQLAMKWRHQSSAMCDWLAARIVAAMKNESYGKVLWLDGDNRTAALALAGKNRENDSRELFPFELLRRKAEKRLSELGIEVVGRANFRSVKRRIAESKKRKKRPASAKVVA